MNLVVLDSAALEALLRRVVREELAAQEGTSPPPESPITEEDRARMLNLLRSKGCRG